MGFGDRRSSNFSQKAANELKNKFFQKGLSLTPKTEQNLLGIPIPGQTTNRAPFLFMPQIPTFEGGSLTPGATIFPGKLGKAIQFIQNIVNLLQQFPLALEVPPTTVDYRYTKNKNVEPTMAGYVEWHWGEQVDTISASMSTGVFMNADTGLAEGPDRRVTFSYINYENLLRLYKNNGAFYDGFGKVMIFSGLFLINDIGIFNGYFIDFSVTETGNKPFNFNLTWTFKVKSVTHLFVNF